MAVILSHVIFHAFLYRNILSLYLLLTTIVNGYRLWIWSIG